MTDTQLHRTASPDLAAYRVRRERELSSLYATARSLTALGEIDAVLESIVRHAHELIGTDFTYLSLLTPEGGLMLKAAVPVLHARTRIVVGLAPCTCARHTSLLENAIRRPTTTPARSPSTGSHQCEMSVSK